MKKTAWLAWLALLVLLTWTAASAGNDGDDCDKEECKTIGDKCTGDFSEFHGWADSLPFSLPRERHSKYCAIGLRCVDGRCKSDNFGQACTPSSNSCFDASYAASYPSAICLSGICSSSRLPGDSCSKDAQCFGRSRCDSGLCIGVALTKPCAYDAECAYNLFCDDGSGSTCQPSFPADAACTRSQQCAEGNRCQPRQTGGPPLCTPPFSRGVGEYCFQEQNPFHIPCQPGLRCSLDHLCQPLDPALNPAATCRSEDQHSDDDDDPSEVLCQEGDCVCNQFTGEYQCSSYFTPSTNATLAMMSLRSCVASHRCKSSERWNPGHCEYEHCHQDYSATMDSLCPELYGLLGDCAYIPLYSTCAGQYHSDDEDDDTREFSFPETLGTVFGVFILVLGVLALAIFWYHRSSTASTYVLITPQHDDDTTTLHLDPPHHSQDLDSDLDLAQFKGVDDSQPN